MNFKPIFLVAILAVSIRIVCADGFTPPPMKDGLWETHATQTRQGKTLSDNTMKICQSQALTKSLQSMAEQVRHKNECTSNVTQSSANSVVEESRCAKGPNAGSVTRIIYTHQGDTASRTEMHFHSGSAETVMVMDTKYLGSCPAGMKPGDSMMGGKIIPGGQ